MSQKFIYNARSHIFHDEKCHYGHQIQKENLRIISGRMPAGIPCKHCKPNRGIPLGEIPEGEVVA